MSENLSIHVPPGYGSVQSLADGSFQVIIPVGSLPDYRELSQQFIALGVGLMFRGRELHGDLRKTSNQNSSPDGEA